MFSERIKTVIDRVDRLRAQVDDHWQIPADEALVLAQLISIGRAVLPKPVPRCFLVTDITTTHAEELAPFVKRLRALPGFTSCAVTAGNGFELTARIRS